LALASVYMSKSDINFTFIPILEYLLKYTSKLSNRKNIKY
jgi:hypothetical protein